MLNRYRHLRQVLLIVLMAFTLVGVQLVQVSPLHDHTQEKVDCALCHLQFSDDALVQHRLTLPFSAAATQVGATLPRFYAASSPSPYQGRAPPRLFS